VSKIKLSNQFIINICKTALNEDLFPLGDITSKLIANKKNVKAKLISNDKGIIAGLKFAKNTFKLVDNKIKFISKKKDGAKIKKGDLIAVVIGDVRNILVGERVALNFLSHLSGIASKTNEFVRAVDNKIKICCTRKTIPSLRVLQKYAVMIGGGTNHRFNLSDEFLIKDNHIAACKDIREIIIKAIKNKKGKKITVEVDNLRQLRSIVGLKFDTILLDNMNSKHLKAAKKICGDKYELEASGGINLKNIKKIRSTGIDRISIGSITQSVNSIDLKLEI
tara:strand:- start:2342 stop:3178 length:837 start_codon:yes stop_codon:yes gene_type:complete